MGCKLHHVMGYNHIQPFFLDIVGVSEKQVIYRQVMAFLMEKIVTTSGLTTLD
jgi:hypothetical protein